MKAPGAYSPRVDRWGSFGQLARRLPAGSAVVIDARVAKLHPQLLKHVAKRSPRAVIRLTAGERAKSFASLESISVALRGVSRGAVLLAVGGGTIGDVSTVAAHLVKRGLRLWQVPTTYLAAVDSSVGGKGAVNLADGKNALGVFHYPEESWLCPELFATLQPAQAREGLSEALKMAACLDAAGFEKLEKSPSMARPVIRWARACKARVCEVDPYELSGERTVLNFGHTLGHVLEAATRFRVRHGEAVGLGMLCALDVGRALGVTGEALALRVERVLEGNGATRARLKSAVGNLSLGQLRGLLEADKKVDTRGDLNMVLLRKLGSAVVMPVEVGVLSRFLPAWKQGDRCRTFQSSKSPSPRAGAPRGLR